MYAPVGLVSLVLLHAPGCYCSSARQKNGSCFLLRRARNEVDLYIVRAFPLSHDPRFPIRRGACGWKGEGKYTGGWKGEGKYTGGLRRQIRKRGAHSTT